MTYYNKNNNSSTFTVHDEKYEISSDYQDINQEAQLHNNALDHRNTIQQPSINNITHYSHNIGNDTIQRLKRIQQYNKAYENCIKQQSGLKLWNNKKRKQLPAAPATSAPMPRNSTDSVNPLKKLFNENNSSIISSFIKKKHISEVKKKIHHRTSQSFIFSHHPKSSKRYSDVLNDKVLVA